MTAPVLIVGAGPTGLALALSLARRGVAFRLIDAGEGPGEQSRAMAVHARTLELYAQFGIADEMVGKGVIVRQGRLNEATADGRREVLTLPLGDMAKSLSPYPFILDFPQDDHERFLGEKLAAAGGAVEWRTRFVGYTDGETGIEARVSGPCGAEETVAASWLCGCDGAHSAVRKAMGVGLPGGTYSQLFYVADVRLKGGWRDDMVVTLGGKMLALMLPVRSQQSQRLIGLAPEALSTSQDLKFDDVRADAERLLGVEVEHLEWFSSYRVHHRVADSFRKGRAFLLGDAGHIHSPAGGQGMNTGIGDALNLGWKLAAVASGRAGDALLNSYESERIGFARALVSTTDRIFQAMVDAGPGGELMRRVGAPLAAMVATRFGPAQAAAFRLLSQLHIHYPESPLSEGRAGSVHGGDRLPWTGAEAEDNFAPLASLDWQAHVYGEAARALETTCGALGLPLHVFAWSEAARHAGFRRDALHLVRPDGYVAVAAEGDGAPGALEAYVKTHDLRFG